MFEVVLLKFENFVISVSFKYFINNNNNNKDTDNEINYELQQYQNDENYIIMKKPNSNNTGYITTVYKNNVILTYNNGQSFTINCPPELIGVV